MALYGSSHSTHCIEVLGTEAVDTEDVDYKIEFVPANLSKNEESDAFNDWSIDTATDSLSASTSRNIAMFEWVQYQDSTKLLAA